MSTASGTSVSPQSASSISQNEHRQGSRKRKQDMPSSGVPMGITVTPSYVANNETPQENTKNLSACIKAVMTFDFPADMVKQCAEDMLRQGKLLTSSTLLEYCESHRSPETQQSCSYSERVKINNSSDSTSLNEASVGATALPADLNESSSSLSTNTMSVSNPKSSHPSSSEYTNREISGEFRRSSSVESTVANRTSNSGSYIETTVANRTPNSCPYIESTVANGTSDSSPYIESTVANQKSNSSPCISMQSRQPPCGDEVDGHGVADDEVDGHGVADDEVDGNLSSSLNRDIESGLNGSAEMDIAESSIMSNQIMHGELSLPGLLSMPSSKNKELHNGLSRPSYTSTDLEHSSASITNRDIINRIEQATGHLKRGEVMAAASHSFSKTAEHINTCLRLIKREKELLEKSRTCSQCSEKPREVTFLPCGHFTVCRRCAEPIYVCPSCNKSILATVDTYLS